MISKEPVRNQKDSDDIIFMYTQQRPTPYETLLPSRVNLSSFDQYLLGGIRVWTTYYSGFQTACQGPVVIWGSHENKEGGE